MVQPVRCSIQRDTASAANATARWASIDSRVRAQIGRASSAPTSRYTAFSEVAPQAAQDCLASASSTTNTLENLVKRS